MMRIFIRFLFIFSIINTAFAHEYGAYKIGLPYKVGAKEYTPTEVKSYTDRGIASWYGKDFDGKSTANGAKFNKNLRTAAHKTLPMPSVILVENLQNGKKTIAVVNDRGPFSETEGRIVDVSWKVASDLDFVESGRTNIRIEYIPELSAKLKKGEDIDIDAEIIKYTTKITPGTLVNQVDMQKEFADAKTIGKSIFIEDYVKSFYVQAGVFEQLPNAQNLYKRLSGNIPKIQIKSETHNTKNYYVVRSGPFEDMNAAQFSLQSVEKSCPECRAMIIII